VISAIATFAVRAEGAPDTASAPPEEAVLDPGVPRERVAGETPAPGPLALFDAVERAWSTAQAESLVAVLDPEEKVHLAFTRGGPRGGWFNRDQAYFLLKDLLTFTKTDRFEFQKFWNLDADGRSPYAVAAREFRMNDGATHADQVYVSLRRRGEQWVVGEIRSIDP
jgi:hypothetical protein